MGVLEKARQVFEVPGHLGVVGAERGLIDLQGAVEKRLGLFKAAEFMENDPHPGDRVVVFRSCSQDRAIGLLSSGEVGLTQEAGGAGKLGVEPELEFLIEFLLGFSLDFSNPRVEPLEFHCNLW